MPSVGSSLATVTAAASTCFVPDLRGRCWSLASRACFLCGFFLSCSPNQLHWNRNVWKRGSRSSGRPGVRAARNVIRDDARVLPTAAIGRGTISNARNPQAGELLPGGRLVVNFHDDPRRDHSRLFLWPIDATTWIVLTPDGDEYAERFADYSRMRVPSWVEAKIPEVGSVESNRGWTLNELSELVREGCNLALCART